VEFEQSLEQKSRGTTGELSGITYHTVEMWQVEWRETAYNCTVGFGTHHKEMAVAMVSPAAQ